MLQLQPCQCEGKPALKLLGDLTIYAVADAKRDLQAQQAASPDLVLDLSGVREIDSAGVQLLLWLKREARQRSHTLALVNHSPAVVEVFDLLEVVADFGDPILLVPSGS